MTQKRLIEYAAHVLTENGMDVRLADLGRNGIALVLPDVTLEDVGYNQDKPYPSSSLEVTNVS